MWRGAARALVRVILVVFGTTGELIKLAPVLLRLDERGHPYVLATTGQQVQQIPAFLDQFGLRQPDVWLARGAGGRDLRVNARHPGLARDGWRGRGLASGAGVRRALRRGPRPPARARPRRHDDDRARQHRWAGTLRATVAHIEGGLRSYDLRHPFPEELNRKLATALSRIHYAPGPWAASNLRRGEVVDTGSNTIRDSLELVAAGEPPVALPDAPFGIVSLHRFELLNNRRLLTETIEALADAARDDAAALHRPSGDGRRARALRPRPGIFDESAFRRIPRLRFFDFVRVERRSAFVVTDSGGSQEECYYLDLPCLVHRVQDRAARRARRERRALGHAHRRAARLPRRPGRFRRRTRSSAGVAVGCDRRRPGAARLRLRSPGSLEDGLAFSTAGPDAGSARGCVKMTASASEVGAGSTLSTSSETPARNSDVQVEVRRARSA